MDTSQAMTALGGALAVVYGARFAGAPPSAAKSAVKTGAVAALALAAVAARAPGLVAVGLALGALGDLFLSRPGTRAFLAGMAAFAAGHLAYAAEFLVPGAGPPLLPAAALLVLALSTEAWLAPRTGALRWPVRGYVAVITLMALAALTLPAGRGLALAGALLFLLSDLLLALDLFVLAEGPLKRIAARGLWAAYWTGQALILWGMAPS
jgi:uncharacterized membrane protein YhhN